jgi:hypothetical protein
LMIDERYITPNDSINLLFTTNSTFTLKPPEGN